ncbi:hypothetical protein I2456_18895 [Mycobacterium kubicae]|uniref:ESX secretion-associated protein EspG n=1 Tax=Mycobacterium kubicae TaxID=120959 RepID=A0AAX1J516_9MYCO|nr:hypothetical protein [Mycobacterium kubicae]QPI36534.1 hypothetical protein I2456_18895 [Mycobacterium kubicae]
MSRIGQIDLVDVQAISDSLGRDFLPHPFVVSQPSRFDSYQEYEDYLAAIHGRLAGGDLVNFDQWVTSYVHADIRVECVVSIVGAPRGRLLAHRRGPLGFLAVQNSEDHVVDVYAVSPYDLGLAIAGSLALTNAGTTPRIVIPGLVRRPHGASAEEDLAVLRRESNAGPVSIPRSHVARYARIQSRWQPARDWGFDRTKKTVAYVCIKDDGDYIYAPGFDYLTPMTLSSLHNRLDEMIAEDVTRLRDSRDV